MRSALRLRSTALFVSRSALRLRPTALFVSRSTLRLRPTAFFVSRSALWLRPTVFFVSRTAEFPSITKPFPVSTAQFPATSRFGMAQDPPLRLTVGRTFLSVLAGNEQARMPVLPVEIFALCPFIIVVLFFNFVGDGLAPARSRYHRSCQLLPL